MSWRPWTQSARRIRQLKGLKRKPPEPIKKWNVVKGDKVEVLAGRDRGKQGTVGVVDRKHHRVFVKGLNTHIRVLPQMGDIPGGRVLSEAPLHISNVALVDPKDNKPCRVKYMFTEEGEKVRVSRRSGAIVPKAPWLRERKDWKSREGYTEGPQDTPVNATTEKTFVPSLLTFEEEIANTLELEATMVTSNVDSTPPS